MKEHPFVKRSSEEPVKNMREPKKKRMAASKSSIARDEVALADGVDEAQQLGSVGAAYDPGMLPGIPVEHLALDVLASPDGRR